MQEQEEQEVDVEVSKKRGPSCMSGDAPEVSIKRRSLGSLGVKIEDEVEHDEGRIQARLKQIGYGKNTVAYDNYITQVPKYDSPAMLHLCSEDR